MGVFFSPVSPALPFVSAARGFLCFPADRRQDAVLIYSKPGRAVLTPPGSFFLQKSFRFPLTNPPKSGMIRAINLTL